MQSSEINEHWSCVGCGDTMPVDARFCSSCGKRRTGRWKIGVRELLILGGISGAIWICGWTMQHRLGGPAPTRHFQAHQPELAKVDDPNLRRLRAAVKAAPESAEAWRKLASEIRVVMRKSGSPPEALSLELVDALRKVLELAPGDASALLALGDIAFERQVFSQSAEFYQKYLEHHPDKGGAVRARLASVLTFVGRTEEAIEILAHLVEENPKNFQARAYLSIAYAQLGNQKKALEVGEAALEFAPNDEAKQRFSLFLHGLKEETTSSADSNLDRLLSSHPVAGSKFIESKRSKELLTIYFRDFPFSEMPVFAQESFMQKIQDAAKKDGFHQGVIELRDRNSGALLHTQELPTSENNQ